MPGQENWRPGLLLESRTIEVALHSAQLLYPKILLWLLTRSSVRSPHASHANTHHIHTIEIWGKSNLDTTWSGSARSDEGAITIT